MPYADSDYERSWTMQSKGMELPTQKPAAHTAGPWTIGHSDWMISRETSMGYRNFPVRAPEGFDIAMVYYDEDDCEQAANLHLIAAAPELLAACRQLLEWAREEYQSEVNEDTLGPIWRTASGAIAKAEGRGE